MKITSKIMYLLKIKWSSSLIYLSQKGFNSLAVDEILVFVSLNLEMGKCIHTDNWR